MRGDGLPVVERIRRTLIALRMPRALELLDHAVQQLERGEASALELIDTLLVEELSVRESRRIKTALMMARLSTIKTLDSFDFSFQPSLEQNEGAKFWLRVMNELKNRGVEDVLIAVVDGLKGFPEAITAVFPQATVQTCIVHLLRHSLDFVSWKDRKPVAAALKGIYRAVDAAAGEAALGAFEESFWGQKYQAIGQSWRRAWGEVIPFYAFPGDVRRILYTTNAIEALNAKLRRAVRARGHFPSDEAATKLLFLVLNRSEREWIMPPREWSMAKSQFAVLFGERFTTAMA